MPSSNVFPGIDGFLGTRASLMLDVVFLAMFAVVPVMLWSIYQVKFRQRYLLHKRLQLTLAGILLVAVAAFEVDMQWISGWEPRASRDGKVPSTVWIALYVHLFFAITTAVLWVFVVVQALRQIPDPPTPCPYSGRHRFWATLAAVDLCLTSLTGWVFYLLAFAL